LAARGGEQRETWEMTTVSGSPVRTWRDECVEQTEGGEHYGFYFSAISASPYEPFNRTFDGEETRFPDGWETDNPPDQPVAPRILKDLPERISSTITDRRITARWGYLSSIRRSRGPVSERASSTR
jgi:hypothetical protein